MFWGSRASFWGSRASTRASTLAAFWLLASWLPTEPCAAQSVARQPFSQEERARLSAGQLVVRPVREERDGLRLIGGASWQLVAAAPDAVFRALHDTERYDRMLPGVSRAVLVSDHASMRRVRVEHKRGPLGTSYRMALQFDPARGDLTFKLNDPLESSVRAAWGFLSVRPHGRGQSLVSWGVMADPGESLIVALVRGVVQDWLLKVPQQLKRFVESATGRALYGGAPPAPGSDSGVRSCRRLDGRQVEQCAP